jgi:hypothetical protein
MLYGPSAPLPAAAPSPPMPGPLGPSTIVQAARDIKVSPPGDEGATAAVHPGSHSGMPAAAAAAPLPQQQAGVAASDAATASPSASSDPPGPPQGAGVTNLACPPSHPHPQPAGEAVPGLAPQQRRQLLVPAVAARGQPAGCVDHRDTDGACGSGATGSGGNGAGGGAASSTGLAGLQPTQSPLSVAQVLQVRWRCSHCHCELSYLCPPQRGCLLASRIAGCQLSVWCS